MELVVNKNYLDLFVTLIFISIFIYRPEGIASRSKSLQSNVQILSRV